MNILIVGKTRMGSSRCIGGIGEDGTSRRLMKSAGQWSTTCGFDIGKVFDVDFTLMPSLAPPHTEDVRVKSYKSAGIIYNLPEFIPKMRPVIFGDISNIFDGAISYTQKIMVTSVDTVKYQTIARLFGFQIKVFY